MAFGRAPWAVGCCDAVGKFPSLWLGTRAFVFADNPDSWQCRCRARVRAAGGYGLPFSIDSLEMSHNGAKHTGSLWQTVAFLSTAPSLRSWTSLLTERVDKRRHARSREGGHGCVVQAPLVAVQPPHPFGGQTAAPLLHGRGCVRLRGRGGWTLSMETCHRCNVLGCWGGGNG